MNASNMCSSDWLLLLWHVFCLNRINLFLLGQFQNCAVWLTRLRMCQQWQANFFGKLSICFQAHLAFCRCTSAIKFRRDNRDLPNIARGIWEDIGVRSRQQTTETRQPDTRGGGRKSNYPCVNPASKTDIDPAIIQFSSEFHILHYFKIFTKYACSSKINELNCFLPAKDKHLSM